MSSQQVSHRKCQQNLKCGTNWAHDYNPTFIFFPQEIKYIERIVIVIKILILNQSSFKIIYSKKPDLFYDKG